MTKQSKDYRNLKRNKIIEETNISSNNFER